MKAYKNIGRDKKVVGKPWSSCKTNMRPANAMRTIEEKIKFMVPRGTCYHCGGIMREYLGSESCLLCGRERGHICDNCTSKSLDVAGSEDFSSADVKTA